MARLVHKATDGLSAEAQRLMAAGFRAKKTYAAIARDLEAIGEPVSDSTIARRAAEWRAEQARRQAAREYVQDLVEALKANNFTATEMAEALLTDALIENAESLKEADPLKVQAQNLRAREVAVKEREAALRQRALELDEAKFRALQEREQKARELAAESERREMTPEEMRAKIREIYGLTS